jgi:hypothetical protein
MYFKVLYSDGFNYAEAINEKNKFQEPKNIGFDEDGNMQQLKIQIVKTQNSQA